MSDNLLARCVVCGSKPATTAECAIGGLVIRRQTTHCVDCYVAMANDRNAALPIAMRGIWPIDFDALRPRLPQWLNRAEPEQITRVETRLVEIARYFGQPWPSDVVPPWPRVDSGPRAS